MRQLGKGHSVMFFAPGEVDRHIRHLIPRDKESENGVGVIDILRWAMHETCRDIEHYLPHWAQQGVDHHLRFSAYKKYDSTGKLGVLKESWLQPESRTLEEMYEPISGEKRAWLGPRINDIPALRERLERYGVTQLTDMRMRKAEEQEREVSREVDMERSVNLRPPKVLPAKHTIHNDIRDFINTGIISRRSTAVIPLLTPTGIDKALNSMQKWSPTPLATKDFAITTKRRSRITDLTDYLRPVNWVLSGGSGSDSTIIVISPHEANELLPVIRKSDKVRLHIYAARVTVSMRSFSDLTFYTIPESPATRRGWIAPAHVQTELNLFAGQLYFGSREEFQRVCELLALHVVHPGVDLERIEIDGFVPPTYRTGQTSPLSTSAIATLQRLIVLRRKGIGFDGTDLGRVLNVRLSSSEFAS